MIASGDPKQGETAFSEIITKTAAGEVILLAIAPTAPQSLDANVEIGFTDR